MSGFSIRLKHKIMAIGLVGITGLLTYGGIDQYRSAALDRSRLVEENARDILQLSRQTTIDMLEARRAEKNFQIRRDQSYIQGQGKFYSAVDRDLGELKSLVSAGGFDDLAGRIDAVQSDFKSYTDAFGGLQRAEVELGLDETLGLSAQLDAATENVLVKIKETGNFRLFSEMLIIRQHSRDFMFRRNPADVVEFQESVTGFRKWLAAADIVPGLKSEISRSLDRYVQDFSAWVKVAEESARQNVAMIAAFRKVEPNLAELMGGIQRHYADIVAIHAATRGVARRWALIALLSGIVIFGGVSFLIGRSVSTVLSAMIGATTRLAEGDLAVVSPGVERKDELGAMARAMDVFKTSMVESERRRAEQIETEQRQKQEKREAVLEMAMTVERETRAAVDEVSAGTERMAANAVKMSESASSLADNSFFVSAAAEQGLANAKTLTSAAAELSAAIAEITSQVNSSRTSTQAAVTASSKAQVTIGKLSEAAGKVDKVTSLISQIAGQTNLLALNATIEAARAGEAGRGFAVVASEVKSLAQQTAKATSEITEQINEIQLATRESVESISAISEVIRNVETNSAGIAAAVEKQSEVTSQIYRTVAESTTGAREIAEKIIHVSTEADDVGKRALEIRDGSNQIASEVDGLRSTLVRAVRTPSSDVDRRQFVRVEMDRPGTIIVLGTRHEVTVRDLSEGGVLIEQAISGVAADMPVVLEIDGVSIPLAGAVVRHQDNATSIKFNLTEDDRQVIKRLIEQRRAA